MFYSVLLRRVKASKVCGSKTPLCSGQEGLKSSNPPKLLEVLPLRAGIQEKQARANAIVKVCPKSG